MEAPERRELVGPELVHALGRRQVLKPVGTEIAQPIGARESRGRCRHQDLPAVTAGRDPRRAVHVDPDVALVVEERGAGVNSHSHSDRTRSELFPGLGRRA